MSLICSLTGHDWGETQTEEERDERAGEVVVTEREYRVCDRCSERRVVSENTEVRATGEADDVSATFAPSEEPAEDKATRSVPPADDADTIPDDESVGTAETPEATHDAAILDDSSGHDEKTRPDTTGAKGTGAEVTTGGRTATEHDYVCPDCGYGTSSSSARAGDICPECGAYIEET